MICHKYKVVFVHVPKVAGESIETFFLDLVGLGWENRRPFFMGFNDNPNIGPPRFSHLRAEEYCKYHYLSEELFKSYFKFSFVRNPWSRALSFYRYLNYDRIINFSDFVLHQLPNLVTNEKWFFGSQSQYIYNEKDELLVDFVGRFENIKDDFEIVCNKLNLEQKILPHSNKSHGKGWYLNMKFTLRNYKYYPELIFYLGKDNIKSKNYKDYYSNSKVIDRVGELYSEDTRLLGYDYE